MSADSSVVFFDDQIIAAGIVRKAEPKDREPFFRAFCLLLFGGHAREERDEFAELCCTKEFDAKFPHHLFEEKFYGLG